MSLLTFVLFSFGIFALMQFAIVPGLERRYAVDRSVAAIRRIAALTVAEFVRTVALIAAVTTAFCMTLVLVLQLTVGSSAARLAAAATRIEGFRKFLLFFSPVWSAITIVVLVIALGIYSHRRSKRDLTRVFQSLYERELQRLQALDEQGKLEPRPSTAEMKEVEAKIEQGRMIYQTLDGLDAPQTQKDAVKAKLTEQVGQLMMVHRALDLSRRVSATIDPESAKLPEPETRWEKFQALFISRGLLKSLNGTTRALYICTVALLIPSFVGVVAAPGAATLQARNVTVRDLMIKSGRAEWQQTKASLGTPKQQLNARDGQFLKQIARNYEARLASRQVWTKVELPSSFELRSQLVRGRILTEARKHSPTEWTQYVSGSAVDALSPFQREVVRIPEQALAADAPLGVEGQRLYDELADVASRSPSIRQRLHTWAEPASMSDISRSLVNQIGSLIAGDVRGPLGEVLSGVEFQSVRDDFKRFHETARREFLSDFVAGADPKAAYDRVGRTRASRLVFADFADLQTVMRSATERIKYTDAAALLRKWPAGIEVKEKDIDWKAATADLIDIRHAPGFRRDGNSLTDCLTTYRDLFPGQPDADKTTVAHKLIAVLGTKAIDPDDFSPNGGDSPKPPNPGGGGSDRSMLFEATRITEAAAKEPEFIAGQGDGQSAAFLRARNFKTLNGFAKVGGVLIGWSPTDSWAVVITDLRWQIEGNRVRFILVDESGEHRSRLYRAEIAYEALNYAADGRPTAVTIMRASPLFDHKVYLHPSLVDTPLGQRIIRLDKFVNEYTYTRFSTDPEFQEMKQAHDDVSNENALYQFAWGERILGFVPSILKRVNGLRMSDDDKQKFISGLQEYQAVAARLVADADIRSGANVAWGRRMAIFGESHSSPLRERAEFYDQSLVKKLQESSDTGIVSLDDLGKRIRTTQEEPESDNVFRRWLSPPPEYTSLTGVREREFKAKADELIVPDGGPFVPPFDFMTQISFTSRPLSENPDAGTERAWEYKQFQPLIQKKVLAGVSRDAAAQTVIADATEFTMLQRLFRMAFEGRLGDSFPIEKLTTLSNALSAFAPRPARTARWDTRPEEMRLVREAAKKNQALQAILDRLPKLRSDLGVPADEVARGKGQLTPIN
jgi:hypothetical protein